METRTGATTEVLGRGAATRTEMPKQGDSRSLVLGRGMGGTLLGAKGKMACRTTTSTKGNSSSMPSRPHLRLWPIRPTSHQQQEVSRQRPNPHVVLTMPPILGTVPCPHHFQPLLLQALLSLTQCKSSPLQPHRSASLISQTFPRNRNHHSRIQCSFVWLLWGALREGFFSARYTPLSRISFLGIKRTRQRLGRCVLHDFLHD